MSGVDTSAVSSVADTIALAISINSSRPNKATYKVANVQRLGHPVGRDTTSERRNTVNVQSGGTAPGVDVAGETSLVLRVTNEEDALDSTELSAGESLKSVYSCSRTLRVTLEDEAMSGIGTQSRSDSVDNVGRAQSRVLGKASGVDGIVDLATGELRSDSRVHRSETRRLTLRFTGTSGVDEGVPGARGGSGSLAEDGRGDSRGKENEKGDESLKHVG